MSVDGLSSRDFNHLRSAIDEAAIVAITDRSGKITYVNQKFCAISKYSKEELIGNTHRIINSKHHSAEFFSKMWQTISSGSTWEGEICNRAKDGTLYWVHTTIVPFVDEEGQPSRYVAVRYEITQRVLAEEQLRVQAQKLEISNKELQDFASVAAHDLQEPLRKIQAFSDRLRIKSARNLPAEDVDYLDRIQSSAGRMQNLINDLLSFSQITTKAQPFTQVDLNQVLKQVVSDLEIRLETTQGQVSWDQLPVVEADHGQMQQLFMNLVNNALKFHKVAEPPIVKIESKTLAPILNVSGAYQICVKDNGIGFDEKYLGRIFTIFQRLHGRQEYEGTGIGLAICRKIVERHGGSLTASSVANEGSTFIVTLPIDRRTESSYA
jgi:two-component system sensor kinase FixL